MRMDDDLKPRRSEQQLTDDPSRDSCWVSSDQCFHSSQLMAEPGTRRAWGRSHSCLISCRTCSRPISNGFDKSTRSSPAYHKLTRIPGCVLKRRFESNSQSLLWVQCHDSFLFCCFPNGKATIENMKWCFNIRSSNQLPWSRDWRVDTRQ